MTPIPHADGFFPIRRRMQAERAADNSIAAAAMLSFLFAMGTPAMWADYGARKGSLMLFVAVVFAASAIVSSTRKSVFMAIVILAASAGMSAYSVLALRPKLLVVPFFVLPCAIAGYRGAKAMRREDLPLWV